MVKLSQVKLFMTKLNYTKLNYTKVNHGLNIYCKFLNFICQIYLNVAFGKLFYFILFYLEFSSKNANIIKPKTYSKSII